MFPYISGVHVSQSKRYYNMIPAVYYFNVKKKMLADFQIGISGPLTSKKGKDKNCF